MRGAGTKESCRLSMREIYIKRSNSLLWIRVYMEIVTKV